jgi:hypothetical protein
MLAVGFRNVVATMWSINDADDPVLSGVFYGALERYCARRGDGDGQKVAHTLHEAFENLK